MDSRVDALLCVFALPCSDVHTHDVDVSLSSAGSAGDCWGPTSTTSSCEALAALGEEYVAWCRRG